MTDMTDNPLRALDRWHFKTVENGPFSGNTFPERVPDGEWVKWSDLQNGAFYEALIRDKAAPAQDAVAYWVPNARVTSDGSYEDGPGSLIFAKDASDYEKRIGAPLYAGTPPTPSGNAALVVLRLAHSHLDMDALRVSHCKDAEAIDRALAGQAQAAQPNVALVEIGQFNEIDDGLGTSFCEWNQERYRQPNGTKVYVLATQPQAQEAGRGEPYPSEDHECAYENGDGRCRECSDLAKRAAELDAQQKPASSELERLQAILARPAHQHLQGAHLSKPAADCVLCEEIASRPKQPTAANVPSGLPEISAEDARWLSDNPNTEDILDWIRAYGEQCRIADCRAVVIDDAMVERASVAAVAHNASIYGYDPDQYFGINRQTCLDEARAALTAALGGREGS